MYCFFNICVPPGNMYKQTIRQSQKRITKKHLVEFLCLLSPVGTFIFTCTRLMSLPANQ